MLKLCSYLNYESGHVFLKKRYIKYRCSYSTEKKSSKSLQIAVIGQSTFAAEVYKLLRSRGHIVVGAFTIPDQGAREDPLASVAAKDGTSVFKVKTWRDGKKAAEEICNYYKELKPDLNVLPFCSQFIPMEIINYPLFKTICYHPSILPKHRGVSSISWTLISGDKEAGFSIFWADEGLDTGPILLQESCPVEENDTVDTLYSKFLYPRGIQAMADAVDMVANGTAPKITQPEEGASFEPPLKKLAVRKVNLEQPVNDIHNFIRGLDSSPGAWIKLNGEEVKLFGSKLWKSELPVGEELCLDDFPTKAVIHKGGILFPGNDGKFVNVEKISIGGKMIPASKFGKANEEEMDIVLTEEERKIIPLLNAIWKNILSSEITDATDFFESGAGSMDVVRLIEEVKAKLKVELKNDDVYMAPVFKDFYSIVVLKTRHSDRAVDVKYDGVEMNVNNIDLKFPKQLFINGAFVDSVSGKTLECINPTDESVICQVQSASAKDVENAVLSAEQAFEKGEWSKISSRDRADLMYQLADLMSEHKEELATLESIDAGAVYSLALKTHVGMSIETWRYFAGWADKIHGSTIPVSHARPNRNLTFTRKEPIGVCGLIIPWNYPLMMLSWKMAPCLAAGNTVVIKPAEFTPLTALKFAELTVKAGFPSGVINVLPGKGTVTGVALAEHNKVAKLGFTGSTRVGKKIMEAGAKTNLKKVSLELGGKSPLVVFSDCDLMKSVRMSMGGVFFNKGENCIAAGRIFVESTIHDEFVNNVIKETKKMVIGDPLDRSTHHGPQNHFAHLEKLIDYCKTGVNEGAKLVLGGKRCDRPGYFFEPTVFTDVTDDMYIANEEAFGPVMVISKFDSSDIDSVIERANRTKYGLACGIFTSNINRALYFAENINAGTVFVNTYNKTDVAAPFGGFKQSGFGKDLGEEALSEYLRTKTVTLEYGKN